MSQAAWISWLDRLEGARNQEASLAGKIRAGNTSSIGTSIFALQQSVSRLRRDFDQLQRSSGSGLAVTKEEMTRREKVFAQLERDAKNTIDSYNRRNTPSGANGTKGSEHPKQLLSMQTQIMKDQDQQLDLISKGVSNLKNYSLTVKDETELHVRLLHEIDSDVSRATDGLDREGARAADVAKRSNNFHLYMIILVLFVILVFLLVIGGGR